MVKIGVFRIVLTCVVNCIASCTDITVGPQDIIAVVRRAGGMVAR